jgi:hypothetical protein
MLLAKQYVVQPLYTLFNQSLIAALCIALVVFSLEHLVMFVQIKHLL